MPQIDSKPYCSTNSSYDFGLKLRKVDSQSFLPLANAKYKFASINGEYIFNTNQELENDFYFLRSINVDASYDELFSLLPNNIKNNISRINTYSDFENAFNNDFIISTCDSMFYGENTFGKLVEFRIPILVKETVTPVGYQSKNAVINSIAQIHFIFEDDRVISKALHYFFDGNYYGIFYFDKNVNYDVDIEESSTITQILRNTSSVNSSCNDQYPFDFQNNYCDKESLYPTIEEDVGEVVLTIDNTIQEKHQISVSGNNRVQYRVLVSNTGNASSGNNIVKTSIPKEIEVVEDSISDDGVYSSGDRTIQWRIDYIDPYGEEELTYDVLVPGDKLGKYTVTSSVSSDQQNKLSISEPAIVNVVKNPQTGNITFAIELLLIFTILFVIYNLYRKITKVHD